MDERTRRRYWSALGEELRRQRGPVQHGSHRTSGEQFIGYGLGQGFTLYAQLWLRAVEVGVFLEFSQAGASRYFSLLNQSRRDVEAELGYSLVWEGLGPRMRRSHRISTVRHQCRGFENVSDWRRQHTWLADHLNDLHRVFASRVRRLT